MPGTTGITGINKSTVSCCTKNDCNTLVIKETKETAATGSSENVLTGAGKSSTTMPLNHMTIMIIATLYVK